MIESDILELTGVIDADTEFIPLLSPEDEEIMNAEELPKILPILPLKSTPEKETVKGLGGKNVFSNMRLF